MQRPGLILAAALSAFVLVGSSLAAVQFLNDIGPPNPMDVAQQFEACKQDASCRQKFSEVGPAGPRGPRGPRGIAGTSGERGPRGVRGVAGPRGLAGGIGPQGKRGPPGRPGKPASGERGSRGSRGRRGPRGPRGLVSELPTLCAQIRDQLPEYLPDECK